MLGFTEQLERIGEVVVVLLVGTMISVNAIPGAALWFVPLLLLVIRPVAAGMGMIGSTTTWLQRAFIGWFGIRGIGSIYYLMYAIVHGVSDETARLLTGLTLAVVATSVVVHGVSVTPLMRRYRDAIPKGIEQTGGDEHAGFRVRSLVLMVSTAARSGRRVRLRRNRNAVPRKGEGVTDAQISVVLRRAGDLRDQARPGNL